MKYPDVKPAFHRKNIIPGSILEDEKSLISRFKKMAGQY
jgi:hypothetical protein